MRRPAALGCTFCIALLAAGSPAAAQTDGIRLRADSTNGWKAVLQIGSILADNALREATQSGIPIRIHTRVELWRDGFFDALAGSRAWSTVLIHEPLGKQFIVRAPGTDTDGARHASYEAARAAIEREVVVDLSPQERGRYYYTATLIIETLSLSDLEELERWLQGQLGPAVSGDRSIPGALGDGAKRLVIRLLRLPTRRLEASSARFEVRSLPDDGSLP